MKKTILLSLIAVGTLCFGVGCATVEDENDDVAATRSTTTVHSREMHVAPTTSATTTTRRSTAVQAY